MFNSDMVLCTVKKGKPDLRKKGKLQQENSATSPRAHPNPQRSAPRHRRPSEKAMEKKGRAFPVCFMAANFQPDETG